MSYLSDYERLRLENIQRNEAFLASLGLDSIKPKVANVQTSDIAEIKAKASRERKAQRAAAEEKGPVRRSSRLAGVKSVILEEKDDDDNDEDNAGVDDNNGAIDYTQTPMSPEDLDDFEFQALVKLLKWRLECSRELETEAYKIFQNRTLCEAIRRRRNDENFGMDDIVVWTEIWGIGPGKIRTEPKKGWAWELRDQLDVSEVKDFLRKSRESQQESVSTAAATDTS